MTDIDKVSKEVSKKLNLDEDLVRTICRHTFQCIVDSMKDEDDYRDIMFNGLFKFKLKKRFKENKTRQYSK